MEEAISLDIHMDQSYKKLAISPQENLICVSVNNPSAFGEYSLKTHPDRIYCQGTFIPA